MLHFISPFSLNFDQQVLEPPILFLRLLKRLYICNDFLKSFYKTALFISKNTLQQIVHIVNIFLKIHFPTMQLDNILLIFSRLHV